MKRLLCTAMVVAGFVGLAAVPAHAGPGEIVTVRVGDDNASVGTQLGSQPLLGARADVSDAEACVGFSYQIPFCTSEYIDPNWG